MRLRSQRLALLRVNGYFYWISGIEVAMVKGCGAMSMRDPVGRMKLSLGI